MKIKVLQNFTGAYAGDEGQIMDVPDKVGKDLIRHKLAEPAGGEDNADSSITDKPRRSKKSSKN
jgi:hypothetical protein